MTDTQKRYLPIVLMLLVLLIATAARFYNLGGQSLWYDEGVAFGHSQRTLWEMIPRLQNNVHVPAYFWTLSLFENLVGSTEFGLRSYSVLWGIVSVAATYALGKRLFHPIAGLTAALFVALNSFNIYYSQEVRMYAMLTAISALSMWAFVQWAKQSLQAETSASQSSIWRWALAFAVLNIVGEYTHVSYALVMVAQGVLALCVLASLLLSSFTQFRRAFVMYVVVNLMSVLFFAPWLFVALSQVSAQPNISDPIPLSETIQVIQGWFAFGITYPEGLGGMNVVMYFLLLFGLLVNTDTRKVAWWVVLVPIVWVVVSVGAYLYLELYTRYLRFLLPAQIGFALWMGHGAWVLWRIVPRTAENQTGYYRQLTVYIPKITALVAVLAFAWQLFYILPPLYTDEAYTRDNYREMVAIIEAESDADDAIILVAPGIQEIVDYYYDDTVPVYPLPASNNIVADTQAIIAQHDRIYVVFFGEAEQDPQGLVENTLNSEAFQINSQWVGDVRFERFATPAEFTSTETVNVMFGENIMLETIALNATEFASNDALQLQLEWSTAVALDTRYKVFIQLLDSNGALVAQRDAEPGGNQALTTLWQPETIVTDNHALVLNDLPAGDYTLILGLYELENPSSRLPVADGDFYTVGTLTIE